MNKRPPCSACCHAPFVHVVDRNIDWYECQRCGRKASPDDKYWCAWCAVWGDHQSGWCPEFKKFKEALPGT